LECALSVKLFLFPSLLQLPPLACWVSVRTFHGILEREILCGSATFQQRNQNYETFSSSLLAVRVGTLVEWRFAKDTLSAVNICRPCCGEAFELPVKAVALGINEEDTINTLILYDII
jgi:uncharacterized protein YijF (DUF1287 family)